MKTKITTYKRNRVRTIIAEYKKRGKLSRNLQKEMYDLLASKEKDGKLYIGIPTSEFIGIPFTLIQRVYDKYSTKEATG